LRRMEMDFWDAWVKGAVTLLVIAVLSWAIGSLGLLTALATVLFGDFTLESILGAGLIVVIATIILLPLAVGIALTRVFEKGGDEHHE